ncbi:MAG: ribonuclease III [Deltaproteobacteria bacterium]|nr:ribonuclease III [Deltaproteobacteria bacterium]
MDDNGDLAASDLAAVERALGYRFRDPQVLSMALTHRSYVNERSDDELGHNERLEFLGDAVIDVVVGEALMQRLPDAREGRLSKLRALVVSEATLARTARQVSLGACLQLGRGEEQTGGREKPSLLSDALEAVVGAIYLDGGFERAKQVVLRLLEVALEQAVDGGLDADYKTRLQEVMQAQAQQPPTYTVIGERGPDHAKTFEVAVTLADGDTARGEGRSKKEAEQAAARQALRTIDGSSGDQ